MAASVVRSGVDENGEVTEPKGKVKEIQKEWSVFEDGALAYKLQEEENVTHYSGNINRRRTVRSDIKVAKTAADEEALQAFKEEHEKVERNRQIEMEDAQTAKKILQEMMEEEKQKMREQRQRENEERDQEAAKELYRQMMEEERRQMKQQRQYEETDEELAARLQAHEERKRQILRQKQRSLNQETEDERLARHLAREEKLKIQQQQQRAQYNPRDDSTRRHRSKPNKQSESRAHREGPELTYPRDHGHKHRSAESPLRDWPQESKRHTDKPRPPADPWEYQDKLRQTEQRQRQRQAEPEEARDGQMPLEPPEHRRKHRSLESREHPDKPRAVNSLEYPDKSRSLKHGDVRDVRRPAETEQHGDQQEPLEPPERRKKHRRPEHSEPKDKHGKKDYLMPNVAGLTVAVDDEPLADLPKKHKPRQLPRQQSAPVYSGRGQSDSDEETDVIAKIQDDEELARRLQREEIQKSRAPAQLSEQQRKQLMHDQKIAIKMQHEEVMFSKKSTYDNYMGKVKDEIADPDPMVHVSRQNKTAVPADAKNARGVQLTDYTAAEVAQQRRTSGSGQSGMEGNIIASIDPTFSKPDPGNVVLIKKKSITEEPSPPPDGDDAFNPVPGTRRKDSKDKGKRSSIFSKLKKK
ncbi:trichohyalin-like isoform X2 [Acanthaster planci]|uniref:Trichohyalin-like isoform X2 n=1 Tax=Acanthaster planci TaxID=133434 RepID=A0A8B7YC66_ACAPL|nr:trichohyalin-like isoform X2 [Acanthaster planci]